MIVCLNGILDHLSLGDGVIHHDVLNINSPDLVELARVHCFSSTVTLLVAKYINFSKLVTLPKNGKCEVILGI